MFVGMSEPAPPGTQMRIEVSAPDGHHFLLRGQVAHSVSPETAQNEGKLPGVGVRFLDLTDEESAALEQLMEQARGVAADGSSKLPALPLDEDGPQAMVDALRSTLGDMKEQDYFEVLGLPHDASQDDVRRGYLMQVKKWHPSRFAARSMEVREAAAEVFILIKRAHDELSDPVRLSVLRQRTRDRTNRPGGEGAGQQARRASPQRARSSTGSTELDFALRLSGEGRFDDARKVLTHALATEPDNWLLREHYNVMSGRAALQDDDPEAAVLHFQEALRVNPANADAIHEIRQLMRMRRKARRKVLGRLFGRKSIE
jgi:tetratricopeptide (TPR) repeat protein